MPRPIYMYTTGPIFRNTCIIDIWSLKILHFQSGYWYKNKNNMKLQCYIFIWAKIWNAYQPTFVNNIWTRKCHETHIPVCIIVGSVYRTGTGPQRNCLKEPEKARDAISMQREWENNFPTVLPTFSQHPRPKTFWLNPKDRRPDA